MIRARNNDKSALKENMEVEIDWAGNELIYVSIHTLIKQNTTSIM